MLIYTIIIVVIALIGLLMTIVVLLQSGRGGGLAGIASGGATTQILGTRQAPGVLEKATWTLAAAFIVLCILSNFFVSDDVQRESILQQQSSGIPVQAPIPAPQQSPIQTPQAADGVPAPSEVPATEGSNEQQ